MKQKLLYLMLLSSFYYANAQAIFPDSGWEFQGAHASRASGLFADLSVTAPGPNPAGLDTAEIPLGLSRLFSPTLVDLDGDGDLDIVSGGQSTEGRIFYFENTGTATSPNWVQTALATLDAIAIAPGGNNETRCQLEDIDDDGDYDLFVTSRLDENGFTFNDIHYYENTGTATVPNFVESTIPGIENQNIANFPSISFVDLDNDMDLDMVGMGSDSVSYLQNTGTKLMPVFERKYHLENPWDLDSGTSLVQRNWPHGDVLVTIPNFIDIDADGDFDMAFGRDAGLASWIENVGTASAPDYGTYALQNFSGDFGVDLGTFPTIAFGDVDGDNVLDVIAGTFNPGYFAWFKGINSTLTIEEENLAVQIRVSPNPVKDILTIQFESNQINKTNITMYTITGQMVYGSNKLIQQDRAVKIDVSKLQSGLYFLKIKSGDSKTIVKKITVN
ncbi:T9SS type A sorting domain-containing protein [Kordia sp.]|uniref:T9SS type A sorting domain-containing protein n=1 Tax=Kordia sp. TaxID=1965332 RepID=UPI003D291E6C